MTISSDLLILAKKVNNYLVNATTSFDSTTNHKFTVPAGKRWFLLGGIVVRDVSATLVVTMCDADDKTIEPLMNVSAAAATTALLPNYSGTNFSNVPGMPKILDVGEYINVAFGVAQGTNAELSCIVLEVDV